MSAPRGSVMRRLAALDRRALAMINGPERPPGQPPSPPLPRAKTRVRLQGVALFVSAAPIAVLGVLATSGNGIIFLAVMAVALPVGLPIFFTGTRRGFIRAELGVWVALTVLAAASVLALVPVFVIPWLSVTAVLLYVAFAGPDEAAESPG